ncbi:MAG: rhombotarget lipoprotein [Burkholderiales bacterium]
MHLPIRITVYLVLGLVLAAALGCAGTRTRHNTSVVDYLYPQKKDPIADTGVPVLSLPMRVGIAFVPETHARQGGGLWQPSGFSLTEKKKTELMEQVAAHFKQPDFIKSIEIIPSAYLTPQGSFANLDQIRTMYGTDAIVLVSYDQTQFTDEGMLSITYWTIVGAYVVPGEKNDTHTMVDAVVVHAPSRKMLFRAPGISHVKGRATLVNLSEELRADSDKGFTVAVGNMIKNLDQQLVLFQEKVKSAPEEYKVVRESGQRGGGALDALTAALIALIMAGGLWWSRRRD